MTAWDTWSHEAEKQRLSLKKKLSSNHVQDSAFSRATDPIQEGSYSYWRTVEGHLGSWHDSWRAFDLVSVLNDESHPKKKKIFFFFLVFLGPHLLHVEVPRLGVKSRAVAASLHQSHSNTRSEPAASVTYTTAHGNATSSRFLVGFVSAVPWWELQEPL